MYLLTSASDTRPSSTAASASTSQSAVETSVARGRCCC
nr:TPA_asm: m89 uORF [Murid betaherpesvirus 1]DBA08039.1 TPA_asm: m89 uORF [Murid betaherpesvirus 1]